MLLSCSRKICRTRIHIKRSVQKDEVTRVIYLHELVVVIALWLDAEIYTIVAKV